MFSTYATLLEDEQVERVHEASLEILSEVGLLVRNEKARERFVRHGCSLDNDSGIVRMPAAVVTEFMKAAPPDFTFRGRDPQFDRTLPADSPVITTASSAPNVIDPVSGVERRATSDDIARIAHLIDALPGYDALSVATLADDAPEDLHSVSRFYPALKNCRKPVRASLIDPREAEQMVRLCSHIAGSEAAFRERPFITFGTCSVIAPLAMDDRASEMLMYYAENAIPNHSITVPNGGLSAPNSMLGSVTQGNAEFLAASVLTQMSRPGTPLLYLGLPTMTDLRTGAYAAGAIETGIMDMAVAQLARFYDVPCGGYIGQTNAKISDAQAGYEKGMSPLAALLGGFHFFQMGGLVDALMDFDYGQAVIDAEIGMMLKRVARGIEFDEDHLALDVIKKVGPAHMFIDHPHTLEHMRTSAFLPDIADRDSREQWAERGATDAHTRALSRARQILTQRNHSVLSPGVDAKIRAEFTNLVAGDSLPPDGWTPVVTKSAPLREKRRRRRAR